MSAREGNDAQRETATDISAPAVESCGSAPDVPLFTQGVVTLAVEEGSREAPALRHPWVPGIVVAMPCFGVFNVTHEATGKAMGVREYERAGGALVEMAEWACVCHACGINAVADDGKTISAKIAQHADTPVPFSGWTITGHDVTRSYTIREWFQSLRRLVLWAEFPWEDESPNERATDLLSTLTPISPAVGAQEPASDAPAEVQP